MGVTCDVEGQTWAPLAPSLGLLNSPLLPPPPPSPQALSNLVRVRMLVEAQRQRLARERTAEFLEAAGQGAVPRLRAVGVVGQWGQGRIEGLTQTFGW
jgi:hypothetical protein